MDAQLGDSDVTSILTDQTVSRLLLSGMFAAKLVYMEKGLQYGLVLI